MQGPSLHHFFLLNYPLQVVDYMQIVMNQMLEVHYLKTMWSMRLVHGTGKKNGLVMAKAVESQQLFTKKKLIDLQLTVWYATILLMSWIEEHICSLHVIIYSIGVALNNGWMSKWSAQFVEQIYQQHKFNRQGKLKACYKQGVSIWERQWRNTRISLQQQRFSFSE